MTHQEHASPAIGTHPMVAIDVVPLAVTSGFRLAIGTSPRTGEPFSGQWALPGVLLKPNELLDSAADRALATKSGFNSTQVLHRLQIGAFDTPSRDPREPVISIAYLAVCELTHNTGIRWDENPSGLPFDHDAIVARAKEEARVRWMTDLEFTQALLGSEFNMVDAARIGEALTGIYRRPSNLTRTLSATGRLTRQSIVPTHKPGRPAALWKWQDTR